MLNKGFRVKAILIILQIVLFSACSRNPDVTSDHPVERLEFFDGGKLKKRWFIINNKINGNAFTYYENGTQRSVSNYKDGLQHGKTVAFHKNGKTQTIAYWKHGMVNGFYKEFDSTGVLRYIASFKNDTITGRETFFDEKGIKLKQRFYDYSGQLLYYKLFDEKEKVVRSKLTPLIQNKIDTISFHQTYKVNVGIAAPLKGKVWLFIGELTKAGGIKGITDTVYAKNSRVFTFITKPKKLGRNTISGMFKHVKSNQDTISIDGSGFKLTYFVIK